MDRHAMLRIIKDVLDKLETEPQQACLWWDAAPPGPTPCTSDAIMPMYAVPGPGPCTSDVVPMYAVPAPCTSDMVARYGIPRPTP